MEYEIMNFSKIEEDPFADIDLDKTNITEIVQNWNVWQPTTLQKIMNYAYMTLGITKFFVAIAAVLADLLIIFLILRYKKLRKNFNRYIVHYAAMHFVNTTTAPVFLIAHLLFKSGYQIIFYLYCYMHMIEETFMYMSLLFIIVLGLDWTISFFKPHYLQHTAYKFKFTILYSFLFILRVINCVSCSFGYEYTSYIMFITMPLLIIMLMAMHILRRRVVLNNDQLKTEHYLWISTIGIRSYIPIYFLDVLSRLLGGSLNFTAISLIILLEQIVSTFPTILPIVILVYLIKWNKHVRMAYDTTFRKVVSTYGSDNLDDASDNEEIIEDEGEKNAQSASNVAGIQNIMVP